MFTSLLGSNTTFGAGSGSSSSPFGSSSWSSTSPSSSGPFGSNSSPSSSSTSLFGNSQTSGSSSLFGGTSLSTSNTSPFSANPSSGLFSGSSFSGATPDGTYNQKFEPLIQKDDKDTWYVQCITSDNRFRQGSLEEWRLKDYIALKAGKVNLNATSSSSYSSGLFGSSSTTSPTSSLFGSSSATSPSSSLFSNTSPSSSSSSLFSTNTGTSSFGSSLFGSSNTSASKPAMTSSTPFSFGSGGGSSSSSLFSTNSSPSSSSSLFSGSSLFGSSNASNPSSLFSGGSSLFGGTALNTGPTAAELQKSLVEGKASPYGKPPKFATKTSPSNQGTQSSVESSKQTKQQSTTSSIAGKSRYRGTSASVGPGKYSAGEELYMNPEEERQMPRVPPTPPSSPPSFSSVSPFGGSIVSFPATPKSCYSSPMDLTFAQTSPSASPRVPVSPLGRSQDNYFEQSSSPKKLVIQTHSTHCNHGATHFRDVHTPAIESRSSNIDLYRGSTAMGGEFTKEFPTIVKPEAERTSYVSSLNDINDFPYISDLSSMFYTVPSIKDMHNMSQHQLSRVKGFTVGCPGKGEIHWEEEVDVRKLGDLLDLIKFVPRGVIVNADIGTRGEPLCKPAVVEIYNCFPAIPDEDFEWDEDTLTKYIETVKSDTQEMGAEFISYTPNGIWKFWVPHFTIYKLPDHEFSDIESDSMDGVGEEGAEVMDEEGNIQFIVEDDKNKPRQWEMQTGELNESDSSHRLDMGLQPTFYDDEDQIEEESLADKSQENVSVDAQEEDYPPINSAKGTNLGENLSDEYLSDEDEFEQRTQLKDTAQSANVEHWTAGYDVGRMRLMKGALFATPDASVGDSGFQLFKSIGTISGISPHPVKPANVPVWPAESQPTELSLREVGFNSSSKPSILSVPTPSESQTGKRRVQLPSIPSSLQKPTLVRSAAPAIMQKRLAETHIMKNIPSTLRHIANPWTELSDANLFMSRSFRVGWAPNGTFVHSGARCLGMDSFENRPIGEVWFENLGLLAGASSSFLPQTSAGKSENASIFGTLASNHANSVIGSNTMWGKEIARAHVKPIVEQHYRDSVCNVGGRLAIFSIAESDRHIDRLIELIELQMASPAVTQNLHFNTYLHHFRELVRLISALYHNDRARSTTNIHESALAYPDRIQRRIHVSNWLKEELKSNVQEMIANVKALQSKENDDDVLGRKLWAYTSGYCLEEACDTAIESGRLYLATLLAQAGSDSVRSFLSDQVHEWEEDRRAHVGTIPASFRDIYEIISGNVLGPRFCTDILGWKQWFGLHLWYGTVSNAPLRNVVFNYDEAWKSQSSAAIPPLPPYLESPALEQSLSAARQSTWISGRPQTYDVSYQLLRFYTDESYCLWDVVDPLTSSPYPLNFLPGWILQTILMGKFPTDMNSFLINSSDNLDKLWKMTDSLVLQLEIVGLWQWGVYAYLNLPLLDPDYSRVRDNAIVALISRHAPSLFSAPQVQARNPGEVEDEGSSHIAEFLLSQLHIPPEWLHISVAWFARTNGLVEEELEQLIAAGPLAEPEAASRANSLLCHVIAPKYILLGERDTLTDILRRARTKLPSMEWSRGPGLFDEYLNLGIEAFMFKWDAQSVQRLSLDDRDEIALYLEHMRHLRDCIFQWKENEEANRNATTEELACIADISAKLFEAILLAETLISSFGEEDIMMESGPSTAEFLVQRRKNAIQVSQLVATDLDGLMVHDSYRVQFAQKMAAQYLNLLK